MLRARSGGCMAESAHAGCYAIVMMGDRWHVICVYLLVFISIIFSPESIFCTILSIFGWTSKLNIQCRLSLPPRPHTLLLYLLQLMRSHKTPPTMPQQSTESYWNTSTLGDTLQRSKRY